MSEFIANLEHKTKKYPCMICFVKACCSELCELLTADRHTMYESLIEENVCPDCSSTEVVWVSNFETKLECRGCGHIFKINSGCHLVHERCLK